MRPLVMCPLLCLSVHLGDLLEKPLPEPVKPHEMRKEIFSKEK